MRVYFSAVHNAHARAICIRAKIIYAHTIVCETYCSSARYPKLHH